ncbi:MAG: hypothetical protein E7310_05235 [Clostridiales bacterium]|nr:hypothetical protein [Clostridiales bacterium]
MLKREELITILKYASFMYKCVNPMTAEKIGLNNCYDNVSAFYNGIIEKLEKDEEIEIDQEEYLKELYQQIKKDVDNAEARLEEECSKTYYI